MDTLPIRVTASVALAVLWLAATQLVAGDETAAKAEKADPVVELIVDPAPEPMPALKYHLLPPLEELIPGNAVPIYLRVTYEQGDEWRRRLYDEPPRYLEMARDQLPLAEVANFLDSYSNTTEQMAAAALRSDANWEYVTEDRDPLTILLPDAQSMRMFARLLAVKARFEIQSGQLDAAIKTLRDGLALSQHVARAPSLVNQLIGAATAGLMFAETEAYMTRPGAGNLYWALAELPRPFISFQRGLSFERQLLVMKFPELSDLDRLQSPAQWQQLSQAMRQWGGEALASDQGNVIAQLAKRFSKPTEKQLDTARAYLRDALHLPEERIKVMSPAEVEVRYTVGLYDEFVDATQKWFYLPYSQSLSRAKRESEALKQEAVDRELYPLVSAITLTSASVLRAQARADREVARLQAIEALRMHAAATGSLPVTLDEVTIVPVPNDPGTGGPFLYHRDEDGSAVMDIDDSADRRRALRMPVRIRLRGK